MFHLRMIAPEQFAAIREHFHQAGYSEETIRQRFDVKPCEPLNLVTFCTKPCPKQNVEDSLDAIIQLFLVGAALPVEPTAALFPTSVWDALAKSELVLTEQTNEARCLGSVALFPVRGLFLAADRWTNIDHSVRQPFADIVYPAMTKSVKEYLDYTSFAPCEDFLEICAGSAPAALLAAKAAKHVWAADITERSLAFAEFNAAINGIDNITFAKGDLFQAVEGRAFDRIAAHPPYMPALKPTEIFSGGGELGEDLARKIIAELPARLKPGGRFYCRTLGLDRADKLFEETVREWLGEAQAGFDVGVFVIGTVSTNRFALEDALTRDGGRELARQWEKLFEQNAVKELMNLFLVIERVAEQRRGCTVRRQMPANTPAETLEWALSWEVEMHRTTTLEKFAQAKPVACEGTQVVSRHLLKKGNLEPQEFRMMARRPFEVDWRVQPWMPMLLASCDGKTPVSELHELSKKNEWILQETPLAEFCGLLATLLSGGFMYAENFKWPAEAE